ncbi:MATE efflux family protein [Treponema primitia ZAS-2]|uniref:Multidrug export protein MepA n=1 Tax=Treponema primitia (strain ATCC BAA-887 / DSM 12427 / ZAS-2) TaxID=545694 RepID=F5YQJ2_TREPZ|nr:MATE family efflux transporter [Treponema primitia]AEF84068.1 MATE efflux family protein [Treponema primitia ZAS-2]
MSDLANDNVPGNPSIQADAAERLGTDGVGKLLLRFSIPAITGMIVNALYNVVDRIFVGRWVNEMALGGLSLVMPLMTVSMAFAMLFGVGAANMISMRLGQGRKSEAENALNHCFWLLLISGIILMALQLIFLDPLLSILGAQQGSASLPYARSYYLIILYGQVFLSVGFGFSHCTRAQGFPAISMISMFIGAGINFILDPLLIFVFRWGVDGAAWATIIAQLAQAIWILAFSFSKKAVIRLRLRLLQRSSPRSFKPSPGIVTQIMAFGSAQFFLQFVMSAVQLIYNTSVGRYGVASLGVSNGGDIALSGMNINGSMAMLILMPVFGISQGAQPILGFNYGAKKFDRVFKAYRAAVVVATVICVLGFAMTELFPLQLVKLFAPIGSPALLRFTPWAMRVMMLLLPLNGFQIISANFFVVTGRPRTSIILSMLRQCLALIPCIFIFGRIWGLWGIVAAAPVADGVSFVATSIMILFEMKKLRAQMATS